MSAPAAIKATFADFKIVKTRKLAQFVFELPIEMADDALTALGGLPRSDAERWAAIALLDQPTIMETVAELRAATKKHGIRFDADEIADLRHETKERKAFCDLPFPQQAGIRSDDLKFQLWLSPQSTYSESCADVIRRMCGVTSRSKIIKGTQAGDRWTSLLREYEARNHAP
jgi:hypothetical protein